MKFWQRLLRLVILTVVWIWQPAFAHGQLHRNPLQPNQPHQLTPRIFLPTLAAFPPRACQTTQPSEPAPDLWAFVLNFDLDVRLRGCLITWTEQNRRLSYTLIDCFAGGTGLIHHRALDGRQFAQFGGAHYVYCPNFDPPAEGNIYRVRKTLLAVVRPYQTNQARQNPLLYHPFTAASSSSMFDIAFDMPTTMQISPISSTVGLVSRHRIGLGEAAAQIFTSTHGGVIQNWNILHADISVPEGDVSVITHTINAEIVGKFLRVSPVLFNSDPVTLMIGYDPQTSQFLNADVDELILDPKRAGSGS